MGGDFKELAHVIMEAGKSQISRVTGWKSREMFQFATQRQFSGKIASSLGEGSLMPYRLDKAHLQYGGQSTQNLLIKIK